MNLSFGLRPVCAPVSATSAPPAAILRFRSLERLAIELRRLEIPMDRPQFLEAEAIGAEGGIICPRLLHLALLPQFSTSALAAPHPTHSQKQVRTLGFSAVKGGRRPRRSTGLRQPVRRFRIRWRRIAPRNRRAASFTPPQQRSDKKGSGAADCLGKSAQPDWPSPAMDAHSPDRRAAPNSSNRGFSSTRRSAQTNALKAHCQS